jgi:hypothetical protein
MGMKLDMDEAYERGNPIDAIHEYLDGLPGDRISPYDLLVEFQGEWGIYRVHYTWHEPSLYLGLVIAIDLSFAVQDHEGFYPLLNEINSKMNLGHLEYTKETLKLHMRYGVFLEYGILTAQHFELFTDLLLDECDRFYPVVDSFLNQNYSQVEAMNQAFLEVRGNA